MWEVFAELGQVGTCIDQSLGRSSADGWWQNGIPFNALHVVDVMEQIREGVLTATLRRDARHDPGRRHQCSGRAE